jgi:hypothetical protein
MQYGARIGPDRVYTKGAKLDHAQLEAVFDAVQARMVAQADLTTTRRETIAGVIRTIGKERRAEARRAKMARTSDAMKHNLASQVEDKESRLLHAAVEEGRDVRAKSSEPLQTAVYDGQDVRVPPLQSTKPATGHPATLSITSTPSSKRGGNDVVRVTASPPHSETRPAIVRKPYRGQAVHRPLLPLPISASPLPKPSSLQVISAAAY